MKSIECYKLYKCKQSPRVSDPMFDAILIGETIFGERAANLKRDECESALTDKERDAGWYCMIKKVGCPKAPKTLEGKPVPRS
jgi:hypothetical protein